MQRCRYGGAEVLKCRGGASAGAEVLRYRYRYRGPEMAEVLRCRCADMEALRC
jgi:hypothetical protein